MIEALNDQITKKGIEINEYKEKYNIQVQGQDDLPLDQEDELKETKRQAVVVNPIEV